MSWFRAGQGLGVVGVELLNDGIAVAQIKRAGMARPRLLFCEYLPVGPARSHQVVLEEVVRRRKLKGAACACVLAPGNYQLLQIEPPSVEPEELLAALKWKIRDQINFPIEDAVIDAYEPPQTNRSRHVNVVVGQLSKLKSKVDLVNASRLKLQALDTTELAQRNLLEQLPENETGVVLLTLSETRGLILVVKKGQVHLARELELGLKQLAEAQERVTQSYDAVLLELQRSLDFFESTYAQPPITHLYVWPPRQDLREFIGYLSTSLNGVTAASLDLSAIAELSSPLPAETGHQCLNAIGAALRSKEGA